MFVVQPPSRRGRKVSQCIFMFGVYSLCAIRLFFGGFHRIKIVNLELVDTKQPFSGFIAAMWYFDKLVSGGEMGLVRAKRSNFAVIEGLIEFSLRPSKKSKIDPYIIDSFHSLRHHKRQLIFDLHQLSLVDENFRNLLLHSCEEREYSNESKREFGDLGNLFREGLLSVFPNAEQVIIQTSFGYHSYSLSMSNLLAIISSSSVNKIVVDSWCYDDIEQGTWINSLWQSEAAKLKNQFAINGFTVAFESEWEEYGNVHKFIVQSG